MLKNIAIKNKFAKITTCMLLKTCQTIYINLFRLQNKTIWNKIAKTPNDSNASSKCYGLLLKTLVNGNEISFNLPLFFGNKYNVADFQGKCEIFNTFFADQCSPIIIMDR